MLTERRFEIEQALKARFGNGEKFAVRHAELFSRKRLPGKTPTELWDAISILTAKAFPGAPKATHNSIGVRDFLPALSPCFNKGWEILSQRVLQRQSRDVVMEQASGREGGGVPNCQLCRNTVFS